MAKFRIFNIQLLPDEEGVDEVGRAGYKGLFSKLRDLNKQHLQNKTHLSFHWSMSQDVFVGPKEFHFPSGFVWGNFLKYTRADEVTELRTGRTLYRNARSGAGVTGVVEIPFVFDTYRHYLAIDGTSLPRSESFVEALYKFLQPVADENFSKHSLSINLISKSNAIEQVFAEAVAYKTVELSVSFANGHATDELLRELKDSKTHKISVMASGGVKGRMTKIPEFLKDLLRAASKLGWSKISYFVPQIAGPQGEPKKATFDSRDTPLTFSARHSSNDVGDEVFFKRVAEKLADLNVNGPDDDAENIDCEVD